MLVYDAEGHARDSEGLDYGKGYLVTRTRIHHHPAIAAAPEQGHTETLAEYPETGGRDVRWVVDVPGVEARAAWDEEETYTEYVLYTAEELAALAEAQADALGAKNATLKARLDEVEAALIELASLTSGEE